MSKPSSAATVLRPEPVPLHRGRPRARQQPYKPLVSLVVPAYNEAAILQRHLGLLCRHMETLEETYDWEVIIINDGSSDETGAIAEAFAETHANVQVLHHLINFGLGQAFQFAFSRSRGDYVITLDLDLSYSLDHIDKLLTKIRETRAKIVVASPYMRGGRVSDVPWLRRTLSQVANRFLSLTTKKSLSTLTSMVRAYDGPFLRTLNLTSTGMEINPEIIYKALLLRARIEEIPSHLDWRLQNAVGPARRSSLRLARQVMATLLAGYLFRPVIFFIFPGLMLLLFSLYTNGWMLVHFIEQYQAATQYTGMFVRASASVAAAYQMAPHTFVVGLMSLMLAIQLTSLGILALQSQHYFEEIFRLGTTIHKSAGARRRRRA
jgi:glycosyltransferase involved in cell wall biosynthesis